MPSKYTNVALDVTGVYAQQWVDSLSCLSHPADQDRAESLANFIYDAGQSGTHSHAQQSYGTLLSDQCGVYCYLSEDRKTIAVSQPMGYDHLDLTNGADISYDTTGMTQEPYSYFAVILRLPNGVVTLLPRVDGSSGFRIGGDTGSRELARDMQAATVVINGGTFTPAPGAYYDEGRFQEFFTIVKNPKNRRYSIPSCAGK